MPSKLFCAADLKLLPIWKHNGRAEGEGREGRKRGKEGGGEGEGEAERRREERGGEERQNE